MGNLALENAQQFWFVWICACFYHVKCYCWLVSEGSFVFILIRDGAWQCNKMLLRGCMSVSFLDDTCNA